MTDAPKNVQELDDAMRLEDAKRIVRVGGGSRLATIAAISALAGASVPAQRRNPYPNHPAPPPSKRRQSFTEKHGIDREWDIRDKAQAERIAAAEAKRARRRDRNARSVSRPSESGDTGGTT